MTEVPLDAVHQYAYCPRRAYLMYRDGEWQSNYYTEDGLLAHVRVDGEAAPLAPVSDRDPTAADAEPVVARSVALGSQILGVSAKLDLVETDGLTATPVEFKRGKVPDNENRSWPPERIQLMAQGLLLREAGYTAEHGVLYFQGSRRRVEIIFDDDLEEETRTAIQDTHAILEAEHAPDPLIDSPKCNGCSISGICLPDEISHLRNQDGIENQVEIRRFFPARDDALPVYVQEQGAFVGKSGETLVIKKGGAKLADVRIMDASQVVLCGNVQISAQAVHVLADRGIPIVHLSTGHWFYGITRGITLKSAYTRDAQFECARDNEWSLSIAKAFVAAKGRNQRTLLMRNGDKSQKPLRAMKREVDSLCGAMSVEELLGHEGALASIYFGQFGTMTKPRDNLAEFDWKCRNRRPPRDPVNVMLSFGYALLSKECTVALLAVGLDPYWGFFHRPRHGRPALALDLMEEFRPVIVDSVVITAINSGIVRERHFATAAGSCAMNDVGRKAFIKAFESRMDQLVTHPVFDYRLSWRRVIAVQARILARVIRGEVPEYVGMTTR